MRDAEGYPTYELGEEIFFMNGDLVVFKSCRSESLADALARAMVS